MATRLYLTNAAPTSSNINDLKGTWDTGFSYAEIRKLGRDPEGASASQSYDSGIGTTEKLFIYAVSEPISTGTLDGSVEWTVGLDGDDTNVDYSATVWVSAGDSNTARGILIQEDAYTVSATDPIGRNRPPVAVSSVACQDGDRVVVELGVVHLGNDVMWYGSTGSPDLTDGDTNVTSHPGWVGFSDPNGVFNSAPTADAGLWLTSDAGSTVTLDGSASSDPEDGSAGLAYEWNVIDAAGTGLTDADLVDRLTATPSFAVPDAETLPADLGFQLTVTDSGGLTDTDTTTVTIGHRIWPASIAANTISPGDFTLATEFYVTEPVQVTHIHSWIETSLVAPSEGVIYQVDSSTAGTEVSERVTFASSPTVGEWATVALATPVELVVNQRYRVAVLHLGDLPSEGSYFTTGPGGSGLVSGPIVVPNKTEAVGNDQGAYIGGSTLAFPTDTNSDGPCWWSDVTVASTVSTGSGFGGSGSTGSGTGSGQHSGSGVGRSGSTGTGTETTERVGAGSGGAGSAGVGAETSLRFGRGSGRSGSSGSGSGYALQFAAAGIARPVVGLNIRLFEADTVGSYAPDWSSISFTDVYNDLGTVSVEYAKGGVNADLLFSDRAEGALFDGSVEIPGTRFLVTQHSLDAVKEDENTVTLNCPLWVPTRMDESRVYPPEWPDPVPAKHKFAAATPGEIMGILIQEAQGRQALGGLVTNFSSTQTSDGNPWDYDVTLELDSGESVVAVLESLVEMGVCDWLASGRELVLLNPGSGADRTVGSDPVVLQHARDILDGPEKRDVGELLTSVLVKGDNGVFVEVLDETAEAVYGRLEGYISQSGVNDLGTLTVLGQSLLQRSSTPKLEFTHELALFDEPGPQPWVDYAVGDYLLRNLADGQLPAPFLVKQLSAKYTKNGKVTGQLVLGDKFDAADVALSRRIDALTNGTSGTVAPAPSPTDDPTVPQSPTGLLVTSAAYEAGQGRIYAAVEASWAAVTENTDNSQVTDLSGYQVRWRPQGDIDVNPWQYVPQVTDTDASWSPVATSLSIYVQVRALDSNGNASDWSASVSHTTESDLEPPPVPTMPAISSYLGQLRIAWDGQGLASDGTTPIAMPPDLNVVRVHVSDTAGFTPSASTHEDNLTQTGTAIATGLTYGTTYYVQLVAVDHSGNESAPSAEVSGVPSQVVNVDLGPDAVDQINVRDAAIGSAQIDSLAVNDAHIGSVSIGSLQGGTADFDIVVGGRIATSLTASDRVLFESTGLKMYDNDALKVNVSNTGDALFVGEIRSAISGMRLVWNPDQSQPEIHFHSNVTNSAQASKIYVSADDVNTDRPGIAFVGPDPNENNVVNGITLEHGYVVLSRFNQSLNNDDTFEQIGISNQFVYIDVLQSDGATEATSINMTRNDVYFKAEDKDTLFLLGAGSGNSFGRASLYGNGTGSSIVFENSRLSCESSTNDDFIEIWAADFVVNSSREVKTNIAPLDFSPMMVVRKAPVGTWQYIRDVELVEHPPMRPPQPTIPSGDPRIPDRVMVDPGPPRQQARTFIGPMIEDLPGLLGIDGGMSTNALLSMLMAAVRELDMELDEVRQLESLPIPERVTEITGG